ncbi:sulfotransferase family 2 domain-containing protein [Hoeflea sp. CAU 1731]
MYCSAQETSIHISMTLSRTDILRINLKHCEFKFSGNVSAVAIHIGALKNPYLDQDDVLNAIFIHIPKSAGTSIRRSLYAQKSFHIPASRYKAADSRKFECYFKFSFVRNPYSRLVSAYYYLRQKHDADMRFPDHRWAATYLSDKPTFRDFVIALAEQNYRRNVRKYIHFRDQIDWISEPGNNGERKILVDFVGRYERLEDDFAQISRRLGYSVPLTQERIGQRKEDYRTSYTPQMVDIVSEIYKSDIKAFDYRFE